ncbi:PREDICTED: zinc finger protein 414 [Tinamus guttatus]|uniref:zinc finger protein 414 n=1 Tax=Tinamus guttatus TaxID=94827 RepID=UPI00052E7CDE|nr:PREDICTED: zinc finger protein 414 [Tinamus guttatus]
MKTEKDEVLPTFSVGSKYTGDGAGCSDPALSGGQVLVVGSGGGGGQAQDLRLLKRRPVPGKHYQCSSYGCKLAFHSMQELMDHLKVHYRPTQSLEGKTFHCPTLGCSETFPSMQDLMTHMKVHYKPNRYFKGENCLMVWEHTRGRYTCTQCPYSTASRDEMTLHIEEHRKNPPPPGRLEGDMDFGVGITSFHTKLTPEMENSLYSQL